MTILLLLLINRSMKISNGNFFIITFIPTLYLQSHIDEQSDREEDMRDCESSDEGVNVNGMNGSSVMDFNNRGSPERNSDLV